MQEIERVNYDETTFLTSRYVRLSLYNFWEGLYIQESQSEFLSVLRVMVDPL
jgi:hypothetical protein